MEERPDWSRPAPLVVIWRFVVPNRTGDRFALDMQDVVDVMASCQGCSTVDLGRATDDTTLWSLSSSWESVGEYRRALSSYDFKVRAVPMLLGAADEPSAFETLYGRRGQTVVSAPSARAAESDNSRLGGASGEETPR